MASRENGTSRTELDRHLDPRIRQTFYTPWNKADRFQVQRLFCTLRSVRNKTEFWEMASTLDYCKKSPFVVGNHITNSF